jgi:hypothetical protein
VATLYPAYVRSLAYIAAGDGQKAVPELQKLTDHRNFMVNYLLGSLVQLQLARAYSRTGDKENARSACVNYFHLWKDADPETPILKEASTECDNPHR